MGKCRAHFSPSLLSSAMPHCRVSRPFDIWFCAMLYSPLPVYAKNSRAGTWQFPLHPKSSRDLVPMSGLCLPPRTASFSSADQILLTTNSVPSSSDVSLDSPHHVVSYPLPSLPPSTRPVLSQYWVLPRVSSFHICACVWALLDWQGLRHSPHGP